MHRRQLTLWSILGVLLLSGCATISPIPGLARPDRVATYVPTPVTAAETATLEPPADATAVPPAPAAEEVEAPTDTPTPTPTATATSEPAGLTPEQLAALRPNELGWVPVLEYHLILPGEDLTYSRTPASLRRDLEWLHANNFYPIRFRDLTAGAINIPAGKSPVVLTFDDSDISQYRILADGSVDPQTGMGVLLDFAAEHPDFPPVATFFPLLDVDVPERILFGQPELADQKLQRIVELGGEVGSHTVSHARLDLTDTDRIRWQFAMSSEWLRERIGNGYEVVSLSLPFGMYPLDESLLRGGEAEGVPYAFTGAAEVAGGASASPFDSTFDPYHVRRIQAVPGYLDSVFQTFENRPSLKYISDGDTRVITVPAEETLDPEQQGDFNEARWQEAGREVVRYTRQ